MTWEQRARTQSLRRQDRESLTNRPLITQVTAIDGFREQVTVNSPIGEAFTYTSQPFMSTNSWIRGVPESGSVIVTGFEGSSRRLTMLGYGATNAQTQREGYQAGAFHYRDLLPGEIEISSRGMAQAYFGDRGLLALRGGVVTAHLSQDSLESMQSAPTHVRRLNKWTPEEVGDEERYGLVKRPNPLNVSRERWIKTVDQTRFAREYYRSIKPNSPPTTTLVEHIEGDVMDELGLPRLSTMTGLPIRAQSDYYTSTGSSLTITIDDSGNVEVSGPAEAVEGGRLSFPTGGLRITVLRNVELNATENISGDAVRKVSFNGLQGVELTNTSAVLVPGGVSGTDSVVTCKSICPFIGSFHPDGASKVLAEKGLPIPTP